MRTMAVVAMGSIAPVGAENLRRVANGSTEVLLSFSDGLFLVEDDRRGGLVDIGGRGAPDPIDGDRPGGSGVGARA